MSNENAIEAYCENRKEIMQLIADIQTGLEARKQPLGHVHWGNVGDLVHWREQLQNVADSMNLRGEYRVGNR